MTLNIKYLFVVLSFIIFSCSKKIIGENYEKVDRRKTSDLLDVLDSLALKKPTTFYSKISTKYKDTTMNISFKTSIRMVKDSAVSALITYLSLPIYNSLVTPDTLTIVNKRAKCYVKTKLSYIKETFGVTFDYKNIEELLLGMPLGYEIDQKYFQIHDHYNYIISSHRKREIKKADKKEKLQDDIIVKYYLNNQLNELKKMEINSKLDTTNIIVNYISRNNINGYSIPHEVTIQVQTPRNSIFVNMSYEKVEINLPQQILITIPEKYEICE
jgi:hypothetical protein